MLRIERLGSDRHDRKIFDCGITSLNIFLRQYARQFRERNVGVTWVAVEEENPSRILGYYTLAVGALTPDELPGEQVPLPQVPIILIGCLAVDRQMHGKGFGRLLLLHALHHSLYFSS